MENRIKYIRFITRSFCLVIIAMLVFVSYPEKKIHYKKAIDELESIDYDEIGKNLINYIKGQSFKHPEYISFIRKYYDNVFLKNINLSVPVLVQEPLHFVSENTIVGSLVETSFTRKVKTVLILPDPKYQEFFVESINEKIKSNPERLTKNIQVFSKEFILPFEIYSLNDKSHDIHYIKNLENKLIGKEETVFILEFDGTKIALNNNDTFAIDEYKFLVIENSLGIDYSLRIDIDESIYREIAAYSIRDAIRYCNVKYEESSTGLSILGLKVDKGIVAIFGPLAILLLMIHFFLHIRGLETFIEDKKITEIEEPWFGVYKMYLAKLSIVFVYFLFPLLSALVMYYRTYTTETNPTIPILILITIVICCFYIIKTILRVRKKIFTENSVEESKTVGVIGFHRKPSNDIQN